MEERRKLLLVAGTRVTIFGEKGPLSYDFSRIALPSSKALVANGNNELLDWGFGGGRR